MAPDVYLGVADVIAPDASVCEHMVVMRRMPADRRLSTLERERASVDDDLRHIALRVVAFHATAHTGADVGAEGTADAIRRRWSDSFAQIRSLAAPVLPAGLQDEIETLRYDFLDGRRPCSPTVSPPDASSTGTVTCSPTTSTASPTDLASWTA
jgi:aminoglycoside phosphotransferase family enzyme